MLLRLLLVFGQVVPLLNLPAVVCADNGKHYSDTLPNVSYATGPGPAVYRNPQKANGPHPATMHLQEVIPATPPSTVDRPIKNIALTTFSLNADIKRASDSYESRGSYLLNRDFWPGERNIDELGEISEKVGITTANLLTAHRALKKAVRDHDGTLSPALIDFANAYAAHLDALIDAKAKCERMRIDGIEGVKKSLFLALDAATAVAMATGAGEVAALGRGVLKAGVKVVGAQLAKTFVSQAGKAILKKASLSALAAAATISAAELPSTVAFNAAMRDFANDPIKSLHAMEKLVAAANSAAQKRNPASFSSQAYDQALNGLKSLEAKILKQQQFDFKEVVRTFIQTFVVTTVFNSAGGVFKAAKKYAGEKSVVEVPSPENTEVVHSEFPRIAVSPEIENALLVDQRANAYLKSVMRVVKAGNLEKWLDKLKFISWRRVDQVWNPLVANRALLEAKGPGLPHGKAYFLVNRRPDGTWDVGIGNAPLLPDSEYFRLPGAEDWFARKIKNGRLAATELKEKSLPISDPWYANAHGRQRLLEALNQRPDVQQFMEKWIRRGVNPDLTQGYRARRPPTDPFHRLAAEYAPHYNRISRGELTPAGDLASLFHEYLHAVWEHFPVNRQNAVRRYFRSRHPQFGNLSKRGAVYAEQDDLFGNEAFAQYGEALFFGEKSLRVYGQTLFINPTPQDRDFLLTIME